MALQESLFSLQRVYLLLIVPFSRIQFSCGKGEASWLTAAGLYTGEYPSVWINKGTDSQAAGPDKKKEIGFFFCLPVFLWPSSALVLSLSQGLGQRLTSD